MAYKVLVVDDSSFFRRRVSEILNADPNLEVIGSAVNGKDAVEKVTALSPDVVTMDVEMPVLNGIEAVRQIMAAQPTPILMFSSLTHQGAQATLDALDAGALDFLPKKFDEIAKNSQEAANTLRQRVTNIARRKRFMRRPTTTRSAVGRRAVTPFAARNEQDSKAVKKPSLPKPSGKSYKILVIGTSTGGPVALQKILTQFPANFNLPILLIQHMPAAFTPAFAKRMNSLCKIAVKEAENGDRLQPGVAYLAPGGKQMMLDGTESAAKLRVFEDTSAQISYRPSVDITFGSVAKIFGQHVLGVILTGMGADGREGSRMLKAKGSTIWAQDEESCVVYGMPQAVTAAGISQASIPLDNMAQVILKEILDG
jgi:two-component system chemotaxis response regulator CheB